MTDCIRKKVEFVRELNDAVTKVQPNVASIRYRVLHHRDGWHEEFLEITYNSDARTLRNCSGNSCSAILREIATYLDHGKYDEVEYFEKLRASADYTEETID